MSVFKNKILLSILLFGIVIVSSCKKQLNTNLSNSNGIGANTISGKDVFSQALLTTITNEVGYNESKDYTGDNFDYGPNWMGYIARNSGWSASGEQAQIESFALTFSDANSIWQGLYHNIYDYNFIIGKSSPNSILPGASKVMRAMIFQDLVDQFGNIPYSQAAQPTATITPAYDTAANIYKDLVVQIDTAISEINTSQATVDDSSDIMFRGSKSLWLAFANTIKLRILLREVPNVYAPTDPYITAELANVGAQGGFLGPNQDATINPGFVDATNQQNPFWGDFGFEPNGGSAYQNNSFFCANSIMLDTLQATSDPRLAFIYDTVPGGIYLGNALGANLNGGSPFGPGILQSPIASALLFSASQSLFMQAEAAQRGMIVGSPQLLFKEGVEESFRYLTVPNYMVTADNFMVTSTDPFVNIALSSNPIETILVQKWVAECGLDPLEAYADYRRTGYPVLYSPLATAVPQKRLLYPESEFTQNSANVNAQKILTQADTQIKLFWGM
jgi:hypothetical protein